MASTSEDGRAPGLQGAALVTGGSRRIGRALALRLAAMGHDVALHCRRLDADTEATGQEIEALGQRACAIAADLADEAETGAVIGAASKALGPLSILVNNAAIFELDRLATMTRSSWGRHMAINLRAPAILSQALAAQLPASSTGLIVNLVDERVVNLTPHYLSYSIAKAGLWTMTQVLARDLAPAIRVNALAPGPALPGPGQTQEEFDALCSRLPLRRGTSEDELADALALLVRSPSMTGQLLVLDGGKHLGWLTPAR